MSQITVFVECWSDVHFSSLRQCEVELYRTYFLNRLIVVGEENNFIYYGFQPKQLHLHSLGWIPVVVSLHMQAVFLNWVQRFLLDIYVG